jgi:hypothetical protein
VACREITESCQLYASARSQRAESSAWNAMLWQRTNSHVYRMIAETCRAAAEKSDEPAIRAAYLDVAAEWERLAEQRDDPVPRADSTRNLP